jgi:uncharacterized membrane protein YfcA
MTTAALLLLGLLAGATAGALGIGGGIIYVPALALLFEFAQHDAQGTSLAIVLPAAIVGTFVNARAGRVVWSVAVPAAIGAIGGGLVGARLALEIDPGLLRKLFAVLLVLVALRALRMTSD